MLLIFQDSDRDFASIVVFVAFVVIMTITLVNMIIGLAFDDIANIRQNAKYKKLAAKVKIH